MNALGIRDFFARAPGLHAFLLRRLRTFDGGAADGADGDAATGALDQDVFALLLLLSKLVPSPTAQQAKADALDLDALVPLVRACGTLRAHRARVVASRALVPLVAPSSLPTVALDLAAELPARGGALRQNALHGTLLQLSALVLSLIHI